jgi:hypothetical protein
MRRYAPLALGLLAALFIAPFFTSPLAAASLAGVTMPDSAQAGSHDLKLNGMALRSKAVFKVYVGGLYLPAEEHDWKKVLSADEPRRMVMQWVRSVSKSQICDGWTEGLAANTPNASADVKKNFDALCGFMEDAKAGDRFVFTYLPGSGVEVAINDKVKGTLGGKPFADALFACWIGAHPGPGEAFREGLMGNAK